MVMALTSFGFLNPLELQASLLTALCNMLSFRLFKM